MLPYGLAIFLSAFLLFQIQPAIGKAILPWFGGTAGVWTTCLLFFQAVLLLGYIYSHLLTRWLSPRLQGAVHAALLAASLALLPVTPDPRWRGAPDHPVLQILGLLAVSAGLPCFLLSSTSPLLQAWHALRYQSPVTYRLFSISNLASLAGLLAYPFLIEPALATHTQLLAWSIIYAVFVVACGVTALLAARGAGAGKAPLGPAPEEVGLSRWALWLALPACASALLMAVTAHLTHEVAPVPLLWVLPLAVYLLSFVLCFGSEEWYRPKEFRWLVITALGAMVFLLTPQMAGAPWRLAAAGMIGGLFVACVFCHGELVRLKPHPRRLTSFYLAVALGGVLGGAFVGVGAPLLYQDYAELPVAIGACAMLVIALARGEPSPARTGVAVGGIVAMALLFAPVSGLNQPGVLRFRNFYGAFRIKEADTEAGRLRMLYSGNTLHGSQLLSPALHAVPTTYFSERSGAGRLLGAAAPPRRVGIVGLGAGTLAAYARPGDHYTFYELDPLVLIAAETSFTYMSDCRGRCDVVLGDARLSLEREKPQQFDALILDAFSGDAIPVHLLTREAFQLYFRHLKPEGVLAFHITNRYLDLSPVVAAACEPLGKSVRIVRSEPDTLGAEEAVWAVVTNEPPISRTAFRAWTDDYSNLLSIIRR
jgi:hypothetical protein